ncbi:MAG: hypothetical protein HOO67_02600 [Candidatus Peribacteraceae bacterium]|nr:hypothetical protein [Candidatus Peribacteraceae bacterium]
MDTIVHTYIDYNERQPDQVDEFQQILKRTQEIYDPTARIVTEVKGTKTTIHTLADKGGVISSNPSAHV